MADLIALRQEVEEARQAYDGWVTISIAGRSVEELVEIDLEFRRAERALLVAQGKYQDALSAEIENG
jgi:hypothetical protein